MARGRIPTPTPILKLRGSRWAKDREGEPVPENGRPRRPSNLSDAGRHLWDRLCDQLENMKVLSPADREMLYRYCALYERWQKMERFVNEHGEVYPVKAYNGVVTGLKTFPQMRLLLQISEQMMKIEMQFGLSPASRTRIRTGESGNQSDMDKRMFGPA